MNFWEAFKDSGERRQDQRYNCRTIRTGSGQRMEYVLVASVLGEYHVRAESSPGGPVFTRSMRSENLR